jgi:lipoyl(octanoyl) transferase
MQPDSYTPAIPADLHKLGRVDYAPTVQAMQEFTASRTADMPDEIWLCEHSPLYTQGLAGKVDHLLNPGDIAVISTNRGGQVTYHGPGQVVAYPLVDLQRAGYYVKEYVYRVEEAVIRTLAHFGVTGHRVAGAPGIYVRLDDPCSHALLAQRPQKRDGANPVVPDFSGLGKIAALGIKVSRHCTYHGVALNVDMDLEPFARINPCGYAGLQTVDLSTIGVHTTWEDAAQVLGQQLSIRLAP